MFVLESPAFQNDGRIPPIFSCDGDDRSPPLSWKGAPSAGKRFALICDDPDAPGGTFYHWAIWDIPADWTGLDEDFKPKAGEGIISEAINGFGRRGYRGPCPPKGHGVHHYHFRLFALDVERLPVSEAATCKAVAGAARTHAIATAQLIGLYER